MSYLHRPGGGGAPPGVGSSISSNGPGPAGGPGQGGGAAGGPAAAGAGAMAAGPPLPPSQHPAGMSGRLSDLLDYVKVEFETVSSQAEIMRRDNHEYASHAELHLSEVSAIRRELTELEREHSRAKQAYEEKITELKRQIEAMRAQTGQGPPIPTVIPANTNHFGALMGHPHGMFGQGGPDRERVEMERERAGEQRDVKLVNGAGGHPNGPHGSMASGPGPGHAAPHSASGPGSGMPPHQQQQQQQQGRPGQPPPGYPSQQQQQHHHSDARESLHEREREAAYQQQLGKRTRPDEPMYDGQPPSAKSRMVDVGRPLENGVESRTSAAASFPPVRPPSRTFAQSPHPVPGRPVSAASGGPPPTIANAPPSEPSITSQAGPSNASVDVKPSIGSLNPPIQLQRPTSNQGSTPSHPSNASASSQAPEERAQHPQQQQPKKADGHPPSSAAQARVTKLPDWDVTYNQEVPKKLDVALAHTFLHDSVVCCVRISPDGKLLATGCNRNTTLYDTKSGAIVAQLAEEIEGKPDNYIRAVAFSPDGRRIASGSEDKIIRIWDLASRQLVATLRGHDSEIYSLAFSPDGTQIVSGSGDRTARIWSVEQRKVLKELRIDETRKSENGTVLDAGVTSISISPDGKLIVAGSLDHIVRIWDMKTGQLLDRLKNHKDSVYSVAFLPGGKQLLTGSLDKTLKIWDLNPLRQAMASGQKIDPEAGHTVCKQTFWGHKDFVLSVAASPDGNWIASGSKDRAVQCWDVRTGKAQFVLHGHKNSVISIAMSEVGGLLATGSGDWQARIFKITGMDEPATQSSSATATSSASVPPVTSTAAKASVSAAPTSLSAAIARTISPLPPHSTASQQPQQSQQAPAKQSNTPAEVTKVQVAPTATKENGTSDTNGAQRSKEASATVSVAASASPSAPASASTKEAPAQQEARPPAAASANVPSSPSAMKLDPPVEAGSPKDKPASKEGTVENGLKEEVLKTNGDASKPTSSAAAAMNATAAPAAT